MRISQDDKAALDVIAARGNEIVSRAVAWCAVNSGSRNFEGLVRTRALLHEAFSVLPGEATSVPLPNSVEIADDGAERPMAFAESLKITVRPEAPVQVVLTGHFDTVYPAGSAFREVTPLADGTLNGPGIADMKGGLSVMLAALEALETHPAKDRVGYRVLLTSDEEIGSLGSAPLLAELGRLGHVGLTYEPALADGTMAGERKGSGNFHIRVLGKAAHAGRDFGSGRNAVVGAAEIVTALNRLNGKRVGVTLNVGKISGGGPVNVVPDVAVVRFNVRVPDKGSADWVRNEIEKVVVAEPLTGTHGLQVSLHGGFTRPAKPRDRAQEALISAIDETAGLLNQTLSWKASGGVCEGNNLHAAGLPNVDTLGVRGADIHSTDERAWPESFPERAQLSALILMKLATGEIDGHAIKGMMGNG